MKNALSILILIIVLICAASPSLAAEAPARSDIRTAYSTWADNIVAADAQASIGSAPTRYIQAEEQYPSEHNEAWIAVQGLAPEPAARLYIRVGDTTLAARLADNSSAEALVKLLQTDDITIDMHDYGNFEKVGSLPEALPRNDEQITTQAGDLILYQGDQFVLYYDANSWSFTRLGWVEGITQDELKALLGTGDVTVTLTLNE